MSSPKDEQPKQRIKYKKVDVASASEDNSGIDDPVIDHDETDQTEQTLNNRDKRTTSQIKSCNDLYKYLTHKPLSKLPFLYFFISIFIPIVLGIWYFMNNDTAYIVSGIFGVLTSVYAFNHFRTLIHLKVEVDNFTRLNKDFLVENNQLSYEVSKLSKAHHTLQDTHDKLKDENMKLKANNRKFRSLQKSLKQLNYDNIKGINSIREKATKISTNWNDKVLQRERDVLYKIFERFEKQNRSEEGGMSREHFDEFLALIPMAYKHRFDRLGTFEKLARGKSYIGFSDFGACLDIFALMHVEGCDIEFEITEVSDDEEEENELDIMPILQRQSGVKIKVSVIRKVFDDETKSDND